MLKKETNGALMITRKIVETGRNPWGQHILLNSTTVHQVTEIEENNWGLIANFDDTVKLTPKGKSYQVKDNFYIYLK